MSPYLKFPLVGLLFASQVWALEEADIVGEARAIGSGDLLYRELHDCSEDGRFCKVFYHNPMGQVIARKQLDYSKSLQAPALQVQDLRLGTEFRLEGAMAPDLVVDAGFDNFVRERWTDLSSGDVVRFPFVVVGRQKPLKMKAGLDEDRPCAKEQVCLAVTLDGWLLSALLDPIRLVYDSDRRLLQFRGISNIKDENGGSQKVEINYTYRNQIPAAAFMSP